jgi:hypothetical protein
VCFVDNGFTKEILGNKMVSQNSFSRFFYSDKKHSYMVNANNIINDDPSEEQKKNSRLVSGATQTMYIMADLAPSSRLSAALHQMCSAELILTVTDW